MSRARPPCRESAMAYLLPPYRIIQAGRRAGVSTCNPAPIASKPYLPRAVVVILGVTLSSIIAWCVGAVRRLAAYSPTAGGRLKA